MMVSDLKQGRTDLYLIGITGNIACGKSAVLEMLRRCGTHNVDADTAVHRIMVPGGSAYAPIVAHFGKAILQEDSPNPAPIDRRKLGAIVFANPQALRELEQITHPLVRIEILRQIAEATSHIIVIDAIKLLESGLADGCDTLWAVTCAPEIQLERLMRRNNFSEEEARLRINAQPPQSEKIARAAIVIDNSGTLEETERQVAEAWRKIPLTFRGG
ncbi:dephospho-CoA kinase [Candidatus Chlorohelix allophototropha]|uniref:Dephospho-CoA kinase n=2 Tax=Candidatus Chlorohelix allophototropha TaxID=3003348 RepID=A0ABY9B5A3_9CHLR|nr:dephospho-CoA kinase [Chloroflexota bacterium L227-S17]